MSCFVTGTKVLRKLADPEFSVLAQSIGDLPQRDGKVNL
jgi:hypothetical protein